MIECLFVGWVGIRYGDAQGKVTMRLIAKGYVD